MIKMLESEHTYYYRFNSREEYWKVLKFIKKIGGSATLCIEDKKKGGM